MMLARYLLVAVAVVLGAEDSHEHDSHDHDDHGHEDHGTKTAKAHIWEYAGVFSLKKGDTYTASFAKADHKYADKTMQAVIMACEHEDESAEHCLEDEEAHLDSLFEEAEDGDLATTDLTTMGDLTPNQDAVYLLTFNNDLPYTPFLIKPTSTGKHVIAFQHFPTEFEVGGVHWLLDDHGDAIEPLHDSTEEHDDTDLGNLWLVSIVGTLIGCMASVLGALIVMYSMDFMGEANKERLCKLGSGAIVGVVTLHLLGEAGELAGGWPHNTELGTALTLGVCFPLVLDVVLSLFGASNETGQMVSEANSDGQKTTGDVEMTGQGDKSAGEGASAEGETEEAKLKKSLAWACIFGDAFHNFFDGVLIASAFDSCAGGLGWTVSLAVLVHELPQEMADFLILRSAGWSKCKALLANFGVSLTALLGVVVYIASRENFSFEAQGALLAFSSGVFLSIGFELGGHSAAGHADNGWAEKLVQLLCWLLGAAVIFGIMFWHPVCHAEGDHGHEGHAH